MSTERMEDVYIVEGNVMGEVFVKFVQNCLLPILQPFNGTNSHSVDNSSVHHYEEVADIITGVGSIVRFLPPYLSELNPIVKGASPPPTLKFGVVARDHISETTVAISIKQVPI